MTREERLAAFVGQVRLVIADVWPEGGTMYVSLCEKKEVARLIQEPGWPCLQFSTTLPVPQP